MKGAVCPAGECLNVSLFRAFISLDRTLTGSNMYHYVFSFAEEKHFKWYFCHWWLVISILLWLNDKETHNASYPLESWNLTWELQTKVQDCWFHKKDTAQSLSRFPGTLFLCNTQKWKGGLGTSFSGRPNTQRSGASDLDKHQKVDRYILPVKNVVSITWEMPTRDSFGSPKPGRRLLCVRREVNSLLKLDWLDWRSRQAVWGFVGCWLWCLCSRNNPAPEPTQLALQLQQWLLVDDTTEYLSHVGSFLRRCEQMPFCPRQGTKTHQRNDSIQVSFREPRNYQSDLQVHEGSLTYRSMGD